MTTPTPPRTRPPGPPLMTAARAVATEDTVVIREPDDLHDLAQVPGQSPHQDLTTARSWGEQTGDPLDDLVARVRPATAHAVDPLQVAARLEADGVTDRVARVEYGFDDVFGVAEEAYRRIDPGPPPGGPERFRPAPPPTGSGRRDVAHGLLYLMPAALFPAMLAAVGRGPLVLAVVITGGLGWAWSGGASWLAYQRLGAGDRAGAARVLGWSVLLGLVAGAVTGIAVTLLGNGDPALVAICGVLMAYQLASLLLVFYKREGLLALSMAPAVAAGCCYVVLGPSLRPAALALGASAVLVALTLGLREVARATRGAGGARGGAGARGTDETAGKAGAGKWAGVRADLPGLAWATAYAALSAAYLLHAQAPYLRGQLDVALAAAPLFAGMGVVEWRARRFGEQARALLARVRYPREFAARIWWLLSGGVLVSTGVVAVLAVPLLVGLDQAGLLTRAGVLMAAAHAVLAGAYYLGFLLAGQGRYLALCAALVAAAVLHTVGGLLAGARGDPLVDTGLFLGSALLLQVLWAALLARAAAQAWRYR